MPFFQVDNVRLLDRFNTKAVVGTLYLTATHLIFVDPAGKKETWVSVDNMTGTSLTLVSILFPHIL